MDGAARSGERAAAEGHDYFPSTPSSVSATRGGGARMEVPGLAVLVTGANGFVGGRVAARLAQAGADVDALVRRPGEAEILRRPGIREIEGDFTDPDDAAEAVAGASAVVHCAATVGSDLDQVRRVNRDGTRTISRVALEAGIGRFVHISTGAVYDRGDREVLDEDAPRRSEATPGGDPYSLTKAEAEEEVEAAARDGLPAVILRPPAILGYAPTSTWGVVVPTMIREGRFGQGRHPGQSLAWVHVDDLADAVVLALDSDRASGRVYNVVGGHTTLGAYVDDVRGWFDPPPASPLDPDADDVWQGRYAADRIRDELGWEPQRSYDEGMAESIAHWQG